MDPVDPAQVDAIMKCLPNILETCRSEGLDKEYVEKLVEILGFDQLSSTHVSQIFLAMVPTSVIDEDTAKKLMFWFIRTATADPEKVVPFIEWLVGVVRYKLIDLPAVVLWYETFLAYLVGVYANEFFPHLTELVKLLTGPKQINKSNYAKLVKNADKYPFVISPVLNEYLRLQPELQEKEKENQVRLPPAKAYNYGKLDAFRRAARKLGINYTATTAAKNKGKLAEAEYPEEARSGRNMPFRFIKSMGMLGKWLNNIIKPHNELNLLSTEEGVMLTIIDGPSEVLLKRLALELKEKPTDALLEIICGLQLLSMTALPPVTDFLSDMLLIWDGEDNVNVFSLLNRLYFNSLKDLEDKIFAPLARAFHISHCHVKMRILESLRYLVINTVAIDYARRDDAHPYGAVPVPDWLTASPHRTVVGLIERIMVFIELGLVTEIQSSPFIIAALEFFDTIIYLSTEFNLRVAVVMPEELTVAALMCNNSCTLSEVCRLLMRYKTDLIPYLRNKGLLDTFEVDVDLINASLDYAFKYLWEPEIEGCVDGIDANLSLLPNLDPIGRYHPGLLPILEEAASRSEETVEDMSSEMILAITATCVPGLCELVNHKMKFISN